jgi:hypothetical protein
MRGCVAKNPNRPNRCKLRANAERSRVELANACVILVSINLNFFLDARKVTLA